ncbi:MAG: glycoside hydrolase family 31 protein [Paramuribaculum sp.]|jgi:alpha-D-xyloside xylohydrolase
MKPVIFLASLILCLPAWAGNYKRIENGIKTTVESVDIELQFYTPSILRILKYQEGERPEKKSYSVIKEAEKVPFTITDGDSVTMLNSDRLAVEINHRTGRISFKDKTGKKLLSEKDWGAQFTPVNYGDNATFMVRQSFHLDKDETIYGLGQHQKGKMSQRNQAINLKQKNTEIAIPIFQSIKGYGVFWDNYSPTMFTDNAMETTFDSQAGKCIDYYFINGSNADGVVKGIRELTGQVPMNALWTYGFWQSRERYISQNELVGVVDKYRELNVPLDGIIQDWQYWGTDPSSWNAIEFGNPGFPDPKKMIDDVHARNAHIIISVWPSFGKNTSVHNELKEKQILLDFKTYPDEATVYDVYNPAARRIYWDRMNRNMFAIGMDGWWLDATEPEFSDNDEKLNQRTHDGQYREVFNAFPILSVGGVHDNQRAATGDKRVFILTRSAFAGQQRYGAASWSGDIRSDWNVLHNQISAGLNFSLCGIPYWNTDIGGFASCNYFPEGINDPAFRELYVRWSQFGAFTPMMRSHGTCTPREIYQFGDRGSWEFDALDKSIRLRYILLPYIYSTAWNVSKNHDTFMRALFMDFPEDTTLHDTDGEYMFGRSLLVAPVTRPMYVDKAGNINLNATLTKDVYLPKGSGWYDFWTGEFILGGRNVAKPTPIDIIPLYVRAGSILPVGPDVQYATEKKWDNLEIRVYPGADGSFVLYEDENDNYNYEKGNYTTIMFSWHDKDRTLEVSDRNGRFPGMLMQRKFRIVVADRDKGSFQKHTVNPDRVLTYRGKAMKIRL